MRRLTLLLLAAGFASPALAQHSGHGQPQDPHQGHASPAPAPSTTCTPEHAAMGHCTMPAPNPAPAQTTDPHAGHSPAAQADPHAGHDMGEAAQPPIAPPPPEALSGPAHAQDLFYDRSAAAASRAAMVREHGGMAVTKVLIDRLEAAFGDEGEGYAWDAQFWHGGDIDKLWLTSEGEGAFGGALDRVELQGLWSHAIGPWFDLQAGIRHDLRSGPDRTHVVLGIQGLAPYWFEVGGAVFLSTQGEVTARVEGEYDLRLTQALILQPAVELDFSLQDVPEIGLGSGITTAELGARLRYELFPRSGPAVIAPYVGVQYERALGNTADLRRAAGEEVGGWSLLLGLRTWF